MNKAYIIGIVVSIVIIAGIGISLNNETMPEDNIEVTLDNTTASEPKHYSETLSESVKVKAP